VGRWEKKVLNGGGRRRRENRGLHSMKSREEVYGWTPGSQSPFPRYHDLLYLTLPLYLSSKLFSSHWCTQ
jgi:hypothetical protein